MASLLRGAPWRTLAFVGLLTQVTSPGRGQVVPPPAPPKPAVTAKASTSGEVVELSPFEVRPEDDTGYQAGNTTSGSRLNARLKDTPASVSPFTAEFLSDIAATNLQEMLSYATNIEAELEDGRSKQELEGGRER